MTNVTATGHSDDVFGPWLWSVKWGVTTLSYSFPEDGEPYSYRATSDVQGLDEDQKAAVRAVLAEIASFTGLDFVEIDESDGAARDGAADLRFATEPWMGGAYAYMPTSASQGGDAFFGSATRDPVQGNEAWLYFLHEIGHSMGLEHGHEHPEFVASGLNSQEYTVVTYTDYVGDNATFSFDSGPVDWAQSYQQLDIAAMQFLYGANYAEEGELWSGDTVYGFDPETGEMSVNGIGQGVPAGNRIFRTIWDGHGEDTYDLSTYDSDLAIDLRPGAFSTFDPAQLADLDRFADLDARMARGNVANARLVDDDPRGLIENALGGRGDDEIIGNAARNLLVGRAGDDTLWGDDGADELRGGRGADDLRGGDGNDRLRGQQDNDLMVGGDGNDLLVGGAGDDVLIGDAGFDRLRGGDGADTFRFRSADDSLRGERLDRVLDFTSGEDRIDLTRLALEPLALELDRAPGAAGRDGPVIASAATREKGDNTVVMVDADGDGMAEMRFVLVGALGVSESDFLL